MNLVLSGIVGGLVILVVVLYNGLVRARLRVREAWGAVDVQLQRRASLIPSLVEVVKGYAGHERETLARVIDARGALGTATGPRAAASANEHLSGALGRLFALAEAYPELKADEQFARLQAEMADTENKVAYARNYYNGAVEIYNTRAETVPGLVVAGLFGFAASEFFKADATAKEPVRAALTGN